MARRRDERNEMAPAAACKVQQLKRCRRLPALPKGADGLTHIMSAHAFQECLRGLVIVHQQWCSNGLEGLGCQLHATPLMQFAAQACPPDIFHTGDSTDQRIPLGVTSALAS